MSAATGYAELDGIDWQGVLAGCWRLPTPVLLTGLEGAGPADLEALAAAGLRRRVAAVGLDGLASALEAAGASAPAVLARWLVIACEEIAVAARVADGGQERADRLAVGADALAERYDHELDGAPGPLVLHPALDGLDLPLLELAQAVGVAHPLGRLLVGPNDTARCDGVYLHRHGTILLSPQVVAHPLHVRHVFAHELAHAVDFVTDPHRVRFAEYELVAHVGAVLLLSHQPTTVADAAELLASIHDGPAVSADLPAPGFDTRVVFRALAQSLTPQETTP